MILRKLVGVGSAVALLGVPFSVMAQTVTTGPLGAEAPAIGLPMLVLLALALGGAAMFVLRRSSAKSMAAGAMVAVLGVAAGLVYATSAIVEVSGTECEMVTVQAFSTDVNTNLKNSCPNPIRIISIDVSCTDRDVFGESSATPPAPCSEGQVLTTNQYCRLPRCVS